ncbi:sigma-54-dependent Fis family transcriptional regulator [Vibrio europaeus]|uniref:sigma-54-dependent Fis family transcriptional regulator n=1 Tax=Vibrio europaeus TaxID=300876 RepID=UPI00233EACA3|nr:sigma-54-dependent Fis family transcriptional regulator [Vibrio europaeus]MDC5819317.1 sigma-54-dependent Fis family transcriptional regulator [Vibrio europaeus]MDC5872130.1 sigma-54-dependent Fis family transcriptional regulator [Vibrio europaeus]
MELQTTQSGDWLASSWQRSSNAGLRQIKKPDDINVSNALLKERRYNAQGVIEAVKQCALPLFNQVMSRSESRLILTDSEGVILASWGQEKFREKLMSIALESGTCWQEKWKGTNAIGTALFEQKAVSIIGEQHFIKQHRFISCSASPLFNHLGELVGILDITSEQAKHDVTTQLLVQNMVQLVENYMLTQIPEGSLQINLAHNESVLKSGWQGIVIADENGHVVAHNQVATQLIDQASLVGEHFENLLRQPLQNQFVFEKKSIGKSPSAKKWISAASDLHYGDNKIEQAWQQANKVMGCDISLLILGETGVGKGEFVKALHKHSSRRSEPLVTVNCGALPKDLMESELFGHAPGAFTGANKQGYSGRIRQADKGILFLDEIGEMPLEAQCRLLSVLQDKVVMPVGSAQSHHVDIQVIAATHQDLNLLVSQGKFRQDLYYRLNGLVVTLPSLYERQDKLALIHAIHNKYQQNNQMLSSELTSALMNYRWPGNLRELDNLVKVACLIASDTHEIGIEQLPAHFSQPLQGLQPSAKDDEEVSNLKSTLNATLIDTYHTHNGNVSKVSRALGISRNTVYRKLKALGLMKAK